VELIEVIADALLRRGRLGRDDFVQAGARIARVLCGTLIAARPLRLKLD
jgi:hypothetical protein